MVYLHVPFCRSFCTYCDFYSEVCSDGRAFRRYSEGVMQEIGSRAGEMARCASAADAVDTLYIGGGTPSVLPPDVIGGLVRRIAEAVHGPSGDLRFDEFTVEVNPEDIVGKGKEYVRSLLEMGVDRISMGVQSFDDGVLKWMNRRHDSSRALEAFRILRDCGAGNISIDLMFGISHLSDETWEATIDKALELSPEHISAYQLSIEEGSALSGMIARGRYAESPEDQCRRQYDILCRRLGGSGYRHYEVSNFALPGREAVHNGAYWRRVPYIGLGPGAHSLSPDGIRSWNGDSLSGWTRSFETLSPEDIRLERLMLALRTAEGLPREEIRSLAGSEAVDRLLEEGALVEVSGSIRIPEDRFFVSDEIIRDLA